MITVTVFHSKLASTIFISGWCLTLHFISNVQDLVPIPNLHANFAQGFHVHFTHKLCSTILTCKLFSTEGIEQLTKLSCVMVRFFFSFQVLVVRFCSAGPDMPPVFERDNNSVFINCALPQISPIICFVLVIILDDTSFLLLKFLFFQKMKRHLFVLLKQDYLLVPVSFRSNIPFLGIFGLCTAFTIPCLIT